ncbi:MAG TPA: efflux RND transporter permease subunit [Myxococcaceae bacterium]|nr:efflux RND transporter permease subunit [Myxococcaceae bacterium]
MQWLANISVRRPVFATVLILFLSVLGVAGYVQLGVDRFPKVDIPTVVVVTALPGSSPREVETEITERIEEAVNTISGIDNLLSNTSEGLSTVIIQFVLEKDVDAGVQEVRDKVNGIIPDLPRDIIQPVIQKFDPDAAPVLTLALNGSGKSIRDLTEIADKQVRPLIENVDGVGEVKLIGGRERQINIWVDPVRLRSVGLTAADVQRTVASQNVTLPGGSLETGPKRISVRFQGRVVEPRDFEELVVRHVGGHAIRIRDVARVEDSEEEATTYASRDGSPAVVLSVLKQSGTNSVALADNVRARVATVNDSLPEGLKVDILHDTTGSTRTAVHSVQEHLILGGIFAALVVLIFLGNWRSTIISAVAIPTSIIGTFAVLSWLDLSLNVMTLLALALAVGIVIDDAIVVLENIFRFIHEKGEKPFLAAVNATKEIGLAVLATTLSLIAVFLPVAFMSGIAGRFLASFGITMSVSIAISLLVSFTLTPMMASRWLEPPSPGQAHQKPFLERLTDRFYLPLERLYERVLRWCMAHRWVVVGAMVLALLSIIPLVKMVPAGFLPDDDEAALNVTVRAPEGTSLEQTRLISDRIAREIRARVPEVELILNTIGDSSDRSLNVASLFVKLSDPDQRTRSQNEIGAAVREEIIAKLPPELRVQVTPQPLFSGSGNVAPVQYEVRGPDMEELTRISQRLREKLESVPGTADVDTNLVLGKPEVRFQIDRSRAADLGVNVLDVATTLQLAIGGLQVSSFEEDGFQYEVRVRADAQYRDSLESLGRLTVPSHTLGSVPLMDVVRAEEGEGPATISRSMRQRQVIVYASTLPGVGAGDVLAAVDKEVASWNLPLGYTIAPIGMSREIGRTMQNFLLAFLLSFIFMYLVLAAQFESWLHPFTILLSLPLTVPFALISLLIFNQSLNVNSMLGILVLFGVVKKNSILQIDHTLQLREEGRSRLDAIIEGSRNRLRPILMTTIAFVAGMVPLVTSTGIGAGMNRATAGVVVGGQLLSLVLTLLGTPVAYSVMDDLVLFTRKLFRIQPRDPEATGEADLKRLDAARSGEPAPAPEHPVSLSA